MQATKLPFLFKHQQFFRLWLGQITSQAGAKVYQIAIVWWILSNAVERGGFALGAFMVAGALPALMFYRFIGRVVDRMPAKLMLVGCDLLSTVLLSTVAWQLYTNQLTLNRIYLLGFFIALVEAFFNPAVTKCLPSLVSEDALEQAVAYQASTQYIASFGGSVLGALLIAWLGFPLLVALNAVCYFCSAMIEITLKFPPKQTSENNRENAEEGSAESTGIDWQRFPMLRKLLSGFGLVNFFATPVLVVIPLYVQKLLQGGPSMLGFLEASLWVGILLGTFFAAIVKSEGRNIRMGALCMSIFGVSMFVAASFVYAPVFAICLIFSGMTLGLNNVKFVTLFQKVVPDEVKGRFFAAMQAIISFSFPMAYLFFGYLGDYLTPDRLCLIQGTGIILVAAWFYRLSSGEAELLNYNAA